MKMTLSSAFILVFAIAIITQAQGPEEQKKNATKSEKTVSAFMRQKLDLSKKALEGIVNEDFGLIKESAEEMEKMGRDKQWQVLTPSTNTPISARSFAASRRRCGFRQRERVLMAQLWRICS
jgi:hypothetical protein